MELISQVNTFVGGMNLDDDVTMIPKNQYKLANNVRLITNDSGTTGVLQNIEYIRQYPGGLDKSENIIDDSLVGGDHAVLERNVEVAAYEDFLTGYVNVLNGFLVVGHIMKPAFRKFNFSKLRSISFQYINIPQMEKLINRVA